MNSAIEKLTKYLRLEAKRGYDDRAVVGGLRRMLEPWKKEAQEADLPDAIIEAVSTQLEGYADLPQPSRQEALNQLWDRLASEYPDLPSDVFPDTKSKVQQDMEESGGQETSKAEDSDSEKPVAVEPRGDDHQTNKDSKIQPDPPSESPTPDPAPPAELGSPLTTVQGIGPKSAKTLSKLGLETLGDLLWHLPRRYDDYSQLKTINRLWYGEEVTIIGTVEEVELRVVRNGRLKLVEAVISDGTGSLRVTWFNQTWIADRLKTGRPIVLSGKVDQYLGRLTMNSPEWEALEQKQLHTNRIVPVYPLTAGVSGKWLRRVINSVVTRLAKEVPDHLPESIRTSADLIPLGLALQEVHFPESWDNLKAAQHRLGFDEMFLLQLGVLRQKSSWEALQTKPLIVEDTWIDGFTSGLPYQLTRAQIQTLNDVREDMASPIPMNRLLQGDVGSGKTVIAVAGIGIAAAAGSQAAFMAPTSILAEQHHRTLKEMFTPLLGIQPDKIRILIGSTPDAEKKEIREGLENGSIQVVVGTHALLEDPVTFNDIGLAIIDEQHRFGVEQRAKLRGKGSNPNLLVMTATPIPRSLALTVYGDLDLSVLDELPPGRIPIETRVMRPNERYRAHNFIISQLESGRQGFIIYPLVEGSEKVQTKAAVDEHQRLQEDVFPEYRVGLLHGRMRPEEKETTMAAFREGDIDLMVSTSVVEVGVDIPNASVMLIEGSNHFGLAQLHQFRGRVGRGEHASFCLLIPDQDSDTDNERLTAMESTTDGFELAELDLKQRGPGEFLGTRQSGFAGLRTAQITDLQLIDKARRQARQLFDSDPELDHPDHQLLAMEMQRFWTLGEGEIS